MWICLTGSLAILGSFVFSRLHLMREIRKILWGVCGEWAVCAASAGSAQFDRIWMP